ncbi:peptidoglycan recognition protein family protein [Aquabacterium sp.]|uniref:peptidoglycan recognition protein family protein n=1 Tax=Aquabacterium sp. TaxID=1872578 RepID=UPI002C425CCD|nr:peptidoglycan recognition family protein [Aquabacterium sp.]HSW08931.1 peptidoglycan recognition family protein [Aquabacterium sp.]
MPFLQRYTITPSYLTKPSRRRSGRLIMPDVKFIVAHDTGNPGSTAAGNVRYYERSRDELSASAHLFVDDKQIIECIPALTGPPEKAWHVLYNVDSDNRLYGHDANDAAIGVEYCYGSGIDADLAYRKYVWTIALLCHAFKLDPARSVVGHAFLDPTRKTDPGTGLGHSRRTYDQLLRDIPLEFAECTGAGIGTPAAPAFTAQTGQVRSTARMNLRKDRPSRMAEVVEVLAAGSTLAYVGWTDEGEAVSGNTKWYRDARGCYFWSGAVMAV